MPELFRLRDHRDTQKLRPLLAAATAGRIHFWRREGCIRFWSGARGSYAIACITTPFVTAAGAVAFISTLIVGPHQLSRFVETTLRPLHGKRGSVDEHPPGRIHYNI